MPSNDITFCNNARCKIKCRRNQWPTDLTHISMASFGPINGDPIKEPKDCDMHKE